jgi:di/tricarboxylate transporter
LPVLFFQQLVIIISGEFYLLDPLVITWIILAAAIVLFLSDRIRADLLALLVLVSLGVSGVLTPQEAFSGFSRSAVITIMAVFILAEGLQRTGVTDQAGKLLAKATGRREGWLAISVMLTGAFLSLFMNNIAAASVLLPAVSGAARKVKANPSKLLMPLAFGTILGGMATLFTTTNIVVSSLLRDYGLEGYSVLSFLPLGIPIILFGTAYMVMIGARLLPAKLPIQRLLGDTESNLLDIYRLGERFIPARLRNNSPLCGLALGKSNLRENYNLTVIAIGRNGKRILSPSPETILTGGDVLLMEGRPEAISAPGIDESFELLPVGELREEDLESANIIMVEAILAPRSRLIGQTLRDARFREKYQMNVLGIWRAGRPIRTGLPDLPLQFGDALLLQGPGKQIPILQSDPDFIVLTSDPKTVVPDWRKAIPALLVMVTTLILAAINPVAVGEVMLGGALVMVLIGALTMDQAYRAIEWRSVFLVAGMLPLGIAMNKTGAAAMLANSLTNLLGPYGVMAMLAGLVLLATLLTQVMNGAAVAAVIAPIAIVVAQQFGADPRSMAMGVALATSLAFITPLGHPVNMLVMGPGGYRFRDFVKVGLPLATLMVILILGLLPVFWPLF